MGTLAETAVNAVQGTVDRHTLGVIHVTRNAGIANTHSVVAPRSNSTVSRTCLCTAIKATKSWFAPARTIQAKAIVRAVVQAHCLATVWALELSRALAFPIDTGSLAVAVVWARLKRTVRTCESLIAHTHAIATNTSRLATVCAACNRAVKACGTIRAIALSIVAKPVV